MFVLLNFFEADEIEVIAVAAEIGLGELTALEFSRAHDPVSTYDELTIRKCIRRTGVGRAVERADRRPFAHARLTLLLSGKAS